MLKILLPYIDKKRQELNLDSNYTALLHLIDFCTEHVLTLLEAKHFLAAVILANCTDRLQSVDVSIHRSGTQSRSVYSYRGTRRV